MAAGFLSFVVAWARRASFGGLYGGSDLLVFPGDSSWGGALDGSSLPLRCISGLIWATLSRLRARCSVGVGHPRVILLFVHPSHGRNLGGPISVPLVTWQYGGNRASTWFEIFPRGPSLPPHALSLAFAGVSWRLSGNMAVTVLTSPRMWFASLGWFLFKVLVCCLNL
eukprot:Gb_13749 [translate_table: standard]